MIEFKAKHAYHCETIEEAKWLLNQTDWDKEKKEEFINYWNNHKKQTVYYPTDSEYSNLNFAIKEQYTIIKVKDLMQQNMNTKEMQIIAPEGWEIDREKSTLDKIVFKEIKSKYPMELIEFGANHPMIHKLYLFGQLVLTCREWNKIDGFENETEGISEGTETSIMSKGNYFTLKFKSRETKEVFLSTFKTEIEQVKEFL